MLGATLWFFVLVLLMWCGAVLDHHKDLTVLVAAWALSIFLWVMLGVLLCVRATFRFLRR